MIKTAVFSEEAFAAAQRHWDAVAKPLGALGQFERIIAQIAAIQGTAEVRLLPRCALVFCADHGVVAQGVSQSGSDVTARVAAAVAQGTSNVNLMAQAAQTAVFAVDMGMAQPVDGVIDRRQGCGTADFTQGPAMTRAQAESALQAGIDLVRARKAQGDRLIATGEMGIGNTTAAAALASVLLHQPPARLTGRGAGLSDAGLARKRAAIEGAITRNQPDANDPLDVLAKLGGFEIAGMAGAFLGGAIHGVPVVIDGMISAVSALIAARLCPKARRFMLASHVSREPASTLILRELGLSPVLQADLALGEGTGAVMLFPLLDMALRVYDGSHTFDSLGMAAYTPQEDAP